jgi:hypothetical protein
MIMLEKATVSSLVHSFPLVQKVIVILLLDTTIYASVSSYVHICLHIYKSECAKVRLLLLTK